VRKALVTVINPERWSRTLTADAEGKLSVPTEWRGRYILLVRHSVNEPTVLSGQKVAQVTHVSTLTFEKP